MTWGQLGYKSNSNFNYVNVKTPVNPETNTKDITTYSTVIQPDYFNVANLDISSGFTITKAIRDLDPFIPGTYTLKIYHPTTQVQVYTSDITTTSNQISLVFTDQYTFTELGGFIPEMSVITASTPIDINVLNQINVTVSRGELNPSSTLINVSGNYTITKQNAGDPDFPIGTYDISLLSPNGGDDIQRQVTLTQPSSTLDLSSITFTELGIYYPVGTYTNGSGQSSALDIVNNVNVSCFLKGTKILCLIDGKEEYIAIENIEKETLVKTYKHGYVPVKYNVIMNIFNHYANKVDTRKLYIFRKSKYPELIQDLYVTGGHPILVDDLSIKQSKETIGVWGDILQVDDKYRLLTFLNEDAEVCNEKGIFNMYDLVLENDDIHKQYGIYANGLLTETMSEHYFMNYLSIKVNEII